MRTNLILFLLFIAGIAAAQTNEMEAIKTVINSAYVGGIHNGGPIEDIRAGFHPSFNMLNQAGDQINPTAIEDWIKRIEKGRAENPNANPTKTEAKFLTVSEAGSSGSAVLELYRGGKKIFTDHLLLYKFPEGWRIVSKIYYRHP